jgi:hypothetical protein
MPAASSAIERSLGSSLAQLPLGNCAGILSIDLSFTRHHVVLALHLRIFSPAAGAMAKLETGTRDIPIWRDIE